MHASYDFSRIDKIMIPFAFAVPRGSVDYACAHCDALISVPIAEDVTPPAYMHCPHCASGLMVQTSD